MFTVHEISPSNIAKRENMSFVAFGKSLEP